MAPQPDQEPAETPEVPDEDLEILHGQAGDQNFSLRLRHETWESPADELLNHEGEESGGGGE